MFSKSVCAGLLFLMGGMAFAEPPPRAERAPPSSSPETWPPPFRQTDWQPGYFVPPGWQARYFHYETRYQFKPEPGKGLIIESYADATASWIVTPFRLQFRQDTETGEEARDCITWWWSADSLPEHSVDETTLEGDDFAARIYFFGELEDGSRFGFNYVWSTQQAPGTVWKSPWSSNKMMALRQGPNISGELVPESRDLVADLEAALGQKPRLVDSFAIMTDTEHSGSVGKARISLPTIVPCPNLTS